MEPCATLQSGSADNTNKKCKIDGVLRVETAAYLDD